MTTRRQHLAFQAQMIDEPLPGVVHIGLHHALTLLDLDTRVKGFRGAFALYPAHHLRHELGKAGPTHPVFAPARPEIRRECNGASKAIALRCQQGIVLGGHQHEFGCRFAIRHHIAVQGRRLGDRQAAQELMLGLHHRPKWLFFDEGTRNKDRLGREDAWNAQGSSA